MNLQTAAAPAPSPSASDDEQRRVHEIAGRIRRRVLAHVLANDGGYMSQACSTAELFAALYAAVLDLAPLPAPLPARRFGGVPGRGNPGYVTGAEFHGEPAPDRDRFVISPAHYALVVYAALIEVGRLREDALDQFNRDGSTVEMIGAEHSPGFETTTGSLSQALSQSIGIALARRMRGDSGHTWVFLSDGELQEGQTWEAFQSLAHHRVSGIRVVVDVNGQQCDGAMRDVMGVEPLGERIRAFGLDAVEVDGHDVPALLQTLRAPSDRARVVLARTDPVRGLPLLAERAPLLHYLRFTGPEERARYAEAYEEMSA